jgi:heavy metal sensor kinase
MSRLPIRWRLTLAFALAMAIVLAGMGTFLYVRLDRALDRSVNQGLRASADSVAALVQEADSGLGGASGRSLVEAGESFAQVLDGRGTILDASPLVARDRLLSDEQLARARGATLIVDAPGLPGRDDPIRLLATPVVAQDQPLVVVVGTSLEDEQEALENLRGQLFIGGPVALLLVCLAGYLLAGAALRPVESMRRRAAEISGASPAERLPVPATRDEISRLGETLNDMLARLEATLARERRFVADASHELRTPLALLRTELELALRRTRSPGELEAAVRSAAEETERLSQLAEDLLVLARADQGALPLRPSELPAGQILESVAERFGPRAAAAGRAIVVAGELDVDVRGDPVRLEQALGNLVENALRHGAGRIRLEARRNGDVIELHVADEGAGFPEPFLPEAFERFSRADEARSRGGAGLGLAIVDVVARAHGGSAHAANTDRGADVWISLPLGA